MPTEPPWLTRTGSHCSWHAQDNDFHQAIITKVTDSYIHIRLFTVKHGIDPYVKLKRSRWSEWLAPLAYKSSTLQASSIFEPLVRYLPAFNGYDSSDEGPEEAAVSSDDVLGIRVKRADTFQDFHIGAFVSVAIEGQDQEEFFRVDDLRFDKKAKEWVADGIWLYTLYEAMENLPGRPKDASDHSTLLLSDDRATIPVAAFNERLNVKPIYLANADADAAVQSHWNHGTKLITDLQPDVATDLLCDKLTCDRNALNSLSTQFRTLALQHLQNVYGSRISRRLGSFVGKDLLFDCSYSQILSFESDTLRKAQLEWFYVRVPGVKRKKQWQRHVCFRLTPEEFSHEMGKDWNTILTHRSDPSVSDRVVITGTILLKWLPADPYTLRMVVEEAARVKADPTKAAKWRHKVPLPNAVLSLPGATNAEQEDASSTDAASSSESSSSDDSSDDETLGAYKMRMAGSTPNRQQQQHHHHQRQQQRQRRRQQRRQQLQRKRGRRGDTADTQGACRAESSESYDSSDDEPLLAQSARFRSANAAGPSSSPKGGTLVTTSRAGRGRTEMGQRGAEAGGSAGKLPTLGIRGQQEGHGEQVLGCACCGKENTQPTAT